MARLSFVEINALTLLEGGATPHQAFSETPLTLGKVGFSYIMYITWIFGY